MVSLGKFVMQWKTVEKLIIASVFMKHRICGLSLCLILLQERIGKFNLAQKTDYKFATPINYWSKAYPSSSDRWQGRFKMFATQNMWTFIMLDSFTGRLWQVQYDTKSLDNLLCV